MHHAFQVQVPARFVAGLAPTEERAAGSLIAEQVHDRTQPHGCVEAPDVQLVPCAAHGVEGGAPLPRGFPCLGALHLVHGHGHQHVATRGDAARGSQRSCRDRPQRLLRRREVAVAVGVVVRRCREEGGGRRVGGLQHHLVRVAHDVRRLTAHRDLRHRQRPRRRPRFRRVATPPAQAATRSPAACTASPLRAEAGIDGWSSGGATGRSASASAAGTTAGLRAAANGVGRSASTTLLLPRERLGR